MAVGGIVGIVLEVGYNLVTNIYQYILISKK